MEKCKGRVKAQQRYAEKRALRDKIKRAEERIMWAAINLATDKAQIKKWSEELARME